MSYIVYYTKTDYGACNRVPLALLNFEELFPWGVNLKGVNFFVIAISHTSILF